MGYKHQNVIAVYAVSENGIIGKNNDLPWHLPDEFKHFKAVTLGKPIIMGRKSYESVGKPLPQRRNIVLTSKNNYHPEGVEVVNSLDEAMKLCKDEPEVCIIGGAVVFEEAFEKDLIDEVKLTIVHAEVDGDVFFRLPNEDQWKVVEVDARQADDRNEYAYTIKTLIKK